MIITAKHVSSALEIEPTLGYGGFDQGHGEDLVKHLYEIQLCYDWISCQDIGKRITPRSPSSYFLKHAVEFCTKRYISNGAFLLAVIIAGIPYQRYEHSPNAYVAIRRNRCNRKLHVNAHLSPSYSEFKPLRLGAE